MRGSGAIAIASSLLGFVSHASAQVASICRSEACFKLNIPESTASSGDGDIFFQIAGSSNWEWVALGLGNGMANANIFVVYTSGDGNVTLSPRLADGYQMPEYNPDAEVTLLEGSGVSNGQMIANVRCGNCNSWSGNSADFTADSGEWIYAYQSSGGPKDSTDQSASISQHGQHETFGWTYSNAKGGNSVNPLVNSQPGSGNGGSSCIPRAAATASGTSAGSGTPTTTNSPSDDDDDDWKSRYSGYPTAAPSGRPWGPPDNDDDDDWDNRYAKRQQDLPYCDDISDDGFTEISSGSPGNITSMLIAHGVLAGLAFVIFFPVGSIAIRLASFSGLVWVHGAFQIFAYLVYIAAFGIGIYLANNFDLLNHHHPVIGIVVFILLFAQPALGFLHHVMFKKYQSRTLWSHAHLWNGRLAITLGIINGGLGLRLADTMDMSSRGGMIAYGVIAGIMWLSWVAASIIGETKRKKSGVAKGVASKHEDSPRSTAETADRHDIPPPPNQGHYAPQ